MARNDRRLCAQCIEYADHIAHKMKQRVLVDCFRPVGLAVATHVRRNGVVAGFGQGFELMSPGIPGFGEAVAHQYKRSRSLLGDVHLNPVGLDRTVRHLRHCLS